MYVFMWQGNGCTHKILPSSGQTSLVQAAPPTPNKLKKYHKQEAGIGYSVWVRVGKETNATLISGMIPTAMHRVITLTPGVKGVWREGLAVVQERMVAQQAFHSTRPVHDGLELKGAARRPCKQRLHVIFDFAKVDDSGICLTSQEQLDLDRDMLLQVVWLVSWNPNEKLQQEDRMKAKTKQ